MESNLPKVEIKPSLLICLKKESLSYNTQLTEPVNNIAPDEITDKLQTLITPF